MNYKNPMPKWFNEIFDYALLANVDQMDRENLWYELNKPKYTQQFPNVAELLGNARSTINEIEESNDPEILEYYFFEDLIESVGVFNPEKDSQNE